MIDHINKNKLDNRRNNLRIVTNQENQFNTNCKGYCWRKDIKKYQVSIRKNYKPIHLGFYDTPEEARKVYLEAKKKYHIIRER